MSKVELPCFSDLLTAPDITSWINRCADTFEVFGQLHHDCAIPPYLQIVIVGLRIDEPTATCWWDDNWDLLKKLGSWDTFKAKMKECSMPSL